MRSAAASVTVIACLSAMLMLPALINTVPRGHLRQRPLPMWRLPRRFVTGRTRPDAGAAAAARRIDGAIDLLCGGEAAEADAER